MGEHTALGRTGGSGRIKKNIGILRQWGGNFLRPLRRQMRNLFCQQYLAFVPGNQSQQGFVRNQ